MRNKRLKNRIIFVLCMVLVSLGYVYSFSGGSFDIVGHAKKNDWDVAITNISICSPSDEIKDGNCQKVVGDASDEEEGTKIDSTDKLKATFAVNLFNYMDSITYKVEVKNNGLTPASLADVKFNQSADETTPVVFTYSNLDVNEILKPGDTKTFYVSASYLEDAPIENNTISNTLDLTYILAK